MQKKKTLWPVVILMTEQINFDLKQEKNHSDKANATLCIYIGFKCVWLNNILDNIARENFHCAINLLYAIWNNRNIQMKNSN